MGEININTRPNYQRPKKVSGVLVWLAVLIIVPLWIIAACNVWQRWEIESIKANLQAPK